jgi:hypothetical protein
MSVHRADISSLQGVATQRTITTTTTATNDVSSYNKHVQFTKYVRMFGDCHHTQNKARLRQSQSAT